MSDYKINDDYKARTEQWEDVEEMASMKTYASIPACVMELLARVEKLEAAQHAHIDRVLTDQELEALRNE